MQSHLEVIASGRVVVGRLRTWPGTDQCRFTYEQPAPEGGPTCTEAMISDFDTRTAFETWLGAMLLEGVQRAWPETKLKR